MADINVTESTIDINITEEVIEILSPTGGYPLPSLVDSVFGRIGNVVAIDGDYNLTQLGDVTITTPSSGQVLRYNGTSWVNNTETYVGTVTSVSASLPTGLTIGGSPITTSGTLAFGLDTGYVIPLQSTLDAKALKSITISTTAPITGGGDLSANRTFAIAKSTTSVDGYLAATDFTIFNNKENAIASGTTSQYWRGDKSFQTLNTTAVTEGTNLYYTDARARSAVSFTAGSGAYNSTTGVFTIPTNTSQLTNGASFITLTSLSATSPLSYVNTTGVFSISQANTSTNGYLSSFDWNTFNNKQVALTFGNLTSSDITITGGTGSIIGAGSTLTLATINTNVGTFGSSTAIPVITVNGKGLITSLTTTAVSIPSGSLSFIGDVTGSGTTGSNTTLTLATVNSNVGAYGDSTNVPTITINAKGLVTSASQTAIPTATSLVNGLLNSTDWSTFNNKQNQLNGTGFVKASGTTITYDNSTYLTTISGITAGGELSGTYANPSLVNSAVTGKVLTGVNITGGTIADTDSILTAFGKVQNQINGLIGGSIYKGTWNANTNTPTLTSSVGTSGNYYIVSVSGTTNLNGITDWQVGDWVIYQGSEWEKVDNTDAVVSVNGFTGAVSLTTSNISEGTNLYYTDVRARASNSGGTGISYNSTSGVITNSAPDQVVSLTASTGISTSGTYPSFTITNSAPDQVVALTSGTGISTTGTYPNFTITNSAPDQVVALTQGGTTTISGTYPNFTISSADQYVGTVTSVGITESSAALSITGSPVSTSGNINIGFAGSPTQYVAGDGSLVTFPTIVTQAQNLVAEVYNNTGATLTKGTIVYINGGHGNLPTVTKAIATSDPTSAQTFGFINVDLTNNNNGYVTIIGRLENMDTQAFANGTQLYLSGVTAGTYTSTKPQAPIHLVYVAIVVRSHPTQGVLEVKIQNGVEIDEIHDVQITSLANNNILQYSSADSLWHNVAGTTTNIAEGTNLYYTDTRARASLSFAAGSGAYNSTTGVITIPTNNTQITNGSNYITLTSLSSSATGLTYTNTTGAFSLTAGYVIPTTSSATNWDTAYTNRITSLTTTGSSGASTLVSNTLNIPTYTLSGLGGVPTSRTLTINGTGYDLSADRSWTIPTSVNATFTQDYTATAAQTTFTVTGGYTVGQLAVYYNGSKLASAEFTATNGTTFVLATACQVNDIVQAVVEITGGGIGGSGTTNYISKWTASGVLGNSLIWDNGTNVGIGNQGTTYTLDVSGSGRFTGNLYSSTNILIGTTTVGDKLTVVNSGSYAAMQIGNGTNSSFFGYANASGNYNNGASSGDAIIRGFSGVSISGTNGASTNLYINSAGNVGIGTSSPSYTFDTNKSVAGDFIGRFLNSSSTGYGLYVQTNDNTKPAIRIANASGGTAIDLSGSGVITSTNSTSGAQAISAINNSAANSRCYYGQKYSGSTDDYYMIFDNAVANKFLFYGNGGLGNVQANNGNISDIRTKKDIIPLESYWDKFKAIEIVKFKYIDQDHDDYNIGVIAQQLESIAPEFIDADGWGKDTPTQTEEPLKSVYTTDLYHATIKVLQEAMTKIEEQQAQIQNLQEQINILAK